MYWSEDNNEGGQNVGDDLSGRSWGARLSHQRDYVTHKMIERQLRELYIENRVTKEPKCLVKRQSRFFGLWQFASTMGGRYHSTKHIQRCRGNMPLLHQGK